MAKLQIQGYMPFACKYISRSCYLQVFFCTLFFSSLQAQVTIVLTNADTFPDSIKNNIYISGNFNDWNPAAKDYKLQQTGGVYSLTFNPPKKLQVIEFKFTRGSWSTVETLQDGSFRPNRTYTYTPDMLLTEVVAAWDDHLPDKVQEGTADLIQFTVFSNALNREKNIRVFLPCDYETSGKNYPVVYMLDGQNIFDGVNTPGGEWGVDETMDSLCGIGFETSIIVGIDHAGAMRLTEYSPWKIKKYDAGGEGHAFAEFVTHTLKPKIDALYRTKPEREHTAIAGSSMGGLMSLYIVLNYNTTFSKAAVFSPAFWTSNENFSNAEKFTGNLPTKIYFMAGAKEGDAYDTMFDTQRMYNILLKQQNPWLAMRITIDSYGQHTESFWRYTFPLVYQWLTE